MNVVGKEAFGARYQVKRHHEKSQGPFLIASTINHATTLDPSRPPCPRIQKPCKLVK